jgi:triacylglycerol lipase
MAAVESTHFSLHAPHLGRGAPVILLHGLAASRGDWNSLAPELVAAGYQVYTPDLLGHGLNSKPAENGFYQIEYVYASMVEWINTLGLDQPLRLVGHSLGGYLCLELARRMPEHVRQLALIDPFYTPAQVESLIRLARWLPGREWIIRRIPAQAFSFMIALDIFHFERLPGELRHRLAVDFKLADARILRLAVTIEDLTPTLAGIPQPTLVLWGEGDNTLAPSSFPRLAASLPHARGESIPGCKHHPHLACPERVNRLVLDFFANPLLQKAA